MSRNDDWVKFPVGKIGQGEWCEGCARYNTRNVTCSALAVKEGKVLLVLRANDPQKGFWAMPGGYLDWGETVEECALRELNEETGYEGGKASLLGVYSSPKRDLDGRQNVDCCFVIEVGELVGKADDEVVEAAWFEFDELPEKIAFDHKEMITDFIKSSKF